MAWGRRKGLGLLGTGDCTHPEWLSEIRDSLEETGDGLLAPAPKTEAAANGLLPDAGAAPIRFVLSGEISSIYRQGDRVRKVHTVVFLPSLAAADRFSTGLGRLGNIASDGRPILGLSPPRILELAKDTAPDAFVIPAHVWTPHFSVFGANSGFDDLEACFGKLTGEVFALETGLSSDVTMNRRWSALDRFALVSSSDAHSPSKLGREATRFAGEPSWPAMVAALRTGRGLLGTVEFFPEEGKYHLDGHRKCGVRTDPAETRRLGGRCPVCGGKLTPGVLGRVETLADRPEPTSVSPPQYRLIPLMEVLGEILGTGSGSRRVEEAYVRVLEAGGPELQMLAFSPLDQVASAGGALLAEAVSRMREGRVRLDAGYDGEYGHVTLFGPGEVEALRGQGLLFELPEEIRRPRARVLAAKPAEAIAILDDLLAPVTDPEGLTGEQRAAAEALDGTVLVVAGPGTGKTRTLVARVAAAVRDGCDPERILVITFTNRAADEARERLVRALGPGAGLPVVSTFHAFALAELCRLARTRGEPMPRVQERSDDHDGIALDALVTTLTSRLWADGDFREAFASRFAHVLVDEFQDIGRDQYALLSFLRPRSLFAVGDPDQSIYGFRGAEPEAFDRFRQERPGTRVHNLTVSHRGTPQVLELAARLVRRSGAVSGSAGLLRSARASGPLVRLYKARSPADEADWICREIAGLLGGLDMLNSRAEAGKTGLSDVAVLGRTHAVLEPVARALAEAGIPAERASDRPLWHLAWVGTVMKALAAANPDAEGRDVAAGAVGALDVPGRDAAALLSLIGTLPAGEALRKLQTLKEIDAFGLAPERVHLLTVHAAKGLEFDAVFVAGCEEGVFPPFGAQTGRVNLDEERRLLYVAATRSRGVLALSWPANGGLGTGAVSRFLDRLPAGILEFVDGTARKKPRRAIQQELF